MTRTNKLLVAVFFVLLLWPPVFVLFIADKIRPSKFGQGQMRDFELQRLLNANRCVIDIPDDKDGWILRLSCKDADKNYSSGGASVRGGTRIVLLARRNKFDKRIEFAWYETSIVKQTLNLEPLSATLTTSASGSGSVRDPTANAGVSAKRPDGSVSIGDYLYRGGTNDVSVYPSDKPAEFEVRIELKPPIEIEQNQ